jgi:hypothetical protein
MRQVDIKHFQTHDEAKVIINTALKARQTARLAELIMSANMHTQGSR